MRIVSLLPAATEIVCALGLADDLVGITDACEVPDTAGPRVVARAADPSPGPGSARLDVDDTLAACGCVRKGGTALRGPERQAGLSVSSMARAAALSVNHTALSSV